MDFHFAVRKVEYRVRKDEEKLKLGDDYKKELKDLDRNLEQTFFLTLQELGWLIESIQSGYEGQKKIYDESKEPERFPDNSIVRWKRVANVEITEWENGLDVRQQWINKANEDLLPRLEQYIQNNENRTQLINDIASIKSDLGKISQNYNQRKNNLLIHTAAVPVLREEIDSSRISSSGQIAMRQQSFRSWSKKIGPSKEELLKIGSQILEKDPSGCSDQFRQYRNLVGSQAESDG